MAPLVPNGQYRIENVGKPGNSADLYWGSKFGAITSVANIQVDRQKWTVVNLPDGGITIQNVFTPEAYAGVFQESSYVPVAGYQKPTTWTLKPADAGTYYITANEFSWGIFLNSGQTAVIALIPPSEWGPYSQWRFIPV